MDAAVARGFVRRRRRRHVLGLHPPVANPAPHARRDARARRGRLDVGHFRFERAWRDPQRLYGGAARAGRGDCRGRHCRDCGDADLGGHFPGTSARPNLRACRRAAAAGCRHRRRGVTACMAGPAAHLPASPVKETSA